MNTQPPKSNISARQSGNGQEWEIPAKKGVGFLMICGFFFGGLPLLILALTVYTAMTGDGDTSSISSLWEVLGLTAFLGVFVLIGGVASYLGYKTRYTSYLVCLCDGSVAVVKRFLRKESTEKLERGNVYGVGLYSNSETNGKSDYGLLVKARKGNGIKFSKEYKEDELRWLASEMLVELSKQGGLPTGQEMEEMYFIPDEGEDERGTERKFLKQGVNISLLDDDDFVIEKSGSVIGKSMFLSGLTGMIFSSIFIWIGFGAGNGDPIFGVVGLLIAIVSLVVFVWGLTKFGTTEKYTFKYDTIVKEKLRGGVSQKKTTYRKSSFKRLKVKSSGSSNGVERYSVKLEGGEATSKTLKLFSWVNEDVSAVVKHKVNIWLKPETTSSQQLSERSHSSGYGGSIQVENTPVDYTLLLEISPDEVPIYTSTVDLKDIKGGKWFLRAFLGAFLAIGLGMITVGVSSIKTAKDSETWPSIEGMILKSKITINDGDDSVTYGADVSYQYVINNQTYKGDKVTISEMSTSDRSRARKIVNRYPSGQKVAVFYDPVAPETSVLERGLSGGSWLVPGIGLFFFIIPLSMLIMTEKASSKEAK